MKTSKRILIWTIISLILQFSLYLFLDKCYYTEEENIKIKDITMAEEKKGITPNVVFNTNDQNISLSNDLSYTAYLRNGLVNVVDTNTGKIRENLKYSSGIKCLSYIWIPNTNVIIIAEKLNGNQIRFYSYDAENQIKTEITEDGKINSVPAGKTVEMKISDLTGLLYIKVGYSETRYNIYRIDRNETLNKVIDVKNIGTIALASNDDQLAYEDLISDRIRTNYSPKPTITISGVYRPSIIGTDKNNNFYIGNGREKSNKIYYGNLTENTSNWKSISLESAINNDNIVVNQKGNVYIVDKQNSRVTDVKRNKVYSYEGYFSEINNDYIVYKSGSRLMIKHM